MAHCIKINFKINGDGQECPSHTGLNLVDLAFRALLTWQA
jgi:hypothetical protein